MTSSRTRILLVLVPFVLAARRIDAANAQVPATTIAATLSQAGVATLRDDGDVVEHQSETTYGLSYLHRGSIRKSPWYWGAGLKADSYQFLNERDFPIRRLQSVAGVFSVGYYLDGVEVAHVKVWPGFYFENHMNSSALDVPVEIYSGIPIAKRLNGVVGFMNARFYHHPVPIFGFVWEATSRVRVEAIYPEPALVVAFSDRLEVKLAGKLIGGGYKTDPGSEISRVTYFAYRVGPIVNYKLRPGLLLSLSAGYEAMRVFDAYRDSHRYESDGAPYGELNIQFSK